MANWIYFDVERELFIAVTVILANKRLSVYVDEKKKQVKDNAQRFNPLIAFQFIHTQHV